MAITNGYTTLNAFKSAVTISDTTDDTDIENAIEAASRQIDGLAGWPRRRFWQDSSEVSRTYFPSEHNRVLVDDISTVTNLVVKVDQDDDGVFETTLTIDTDFILEPVNAGKQFPIKPWESIRLLNNTLSTFPCLPSGRPSVQVTAKFGWVAVPDAVERACIVQARNVFKGVDAQSDTIIVGADGIPIRMPAISSATRASIEPYIRWTEVDA